MMARFIAAARGLLSDSQALDGEVELRIVLTQALFVGTPIILIAIGLMAALP